MADTVDITIIERDDKTANVRCTNASDGTGEAYVIKVNISDLAGAPTSIRLKKGKWNVSSGMSVIVAFDHDVDDIVAILAGDGNRDWAVDMGGLHDPGTTGGTGDLVFATHGHGAGDSYDVELEIDWK